MIKFKDLLADAPATTGIKIAGVETPDNQQLEQDFGRLAYAFLKDRAPGLIEFLVGFEVVEQEEDGSRAVGLFGFRIGQSFWYVPVFFVNNQIRGMDLLYSKNESSFVPLQESWINHILSKKTIELGSGADQVDQRSLTSPNFDFLSEPPTGGSTKIGSADPYGDINNWVDDADEKEASAEEFDGIGAYDFLKEACETWNEMQRDTVDLLNNDQEFATSFANAIITGKGEVPPREKRANSPLITFLREHGGPGAVATVLNSFEDTGFLKAATAFYDHTDLMVSEFAAHLKPIEKAATKVQIVEETHDYGDVPVEVKKKIIRDGFTIEDKRDEEEKSDMYNNDYLSCISNPAESGKCRVILASGALAEMYALCSPYATMRPGVITLVDPKTGRFINGYNKAIFVRTDAESAESSKQDNELYSNGVDVENMKVGECYILVSDTLNCSMPFKVKKTISEDGETVRLHVDWESRVDVDHRGSESAYADPYNDNKYCDAFDMYRESELIPVDRQGSLRKTGNNLIVPTQSFKAFKLKKSERGESSMIDPASLTDIHDSLQKEAIHNLRVDSRDEGMGYDIYLNDLLDVNDVTYKTASVRLVRDYGLRVDDVENLLKEAAESYKARRMVKLAQGVMMPPMQPAPAGFDPQLGIAMQYPDVQTIDGNTMGQMQPGMTGPGSGVNIGGEAAMQAGMAPGGPLPDDVNALAQAAAQSGQANAFDHGVIGGLARVYDVSSTIDSFIPELMKSLDRIGRIIFLFYWKNKDFAERYGDSDLVQMEDHIRSVFKQLGDLIIKLKQKTIESDDANMVDIGEGM